MRWHPVRKGESRLSRGGQPGGGEARPKCHQRGGRGSRGAFLACCLKAVYLPSLDARDLVRPGEDCVYLALFRKVGRRRSTRELVGSLVALPLVGCPSPVHGLLFGLVCLDPSHRGVWGAVCMDQLPEVCVCFRVGHATLDAVYTVGHGAAVGAHHAATAGEAEGRR